MDTYAVWEGSLEVRQRGAGRVLGGSFPYGKTGTVHNGAGGRRTRKERIGPDAFGWQLREFAKLQEEMAVMVGQTVNQARMEIIQEQLERRNVHILAGHDFNRVLGDMKRGTARVTSTRESLDFEVDLPDDEMMPTYMLDVVRQVQTGRAGGISPGFMMPPKSINPNAETILPEPGNPGVDIRVINDAILAEASIVSRPVYGSTTVDLRAEQEAVLYLPSLETLWL